MYRVPVKPWKYFPSSGCALNGWLESSLKFTASTKKVVSSDLDRYKILLFKICEPKGTEIFPFSCHILVFGFLCSQC